MKLNSSVVGITLLYGSLCLSFSPACSKRSGPPPSTPSPTPTNQTSSPDSTAQTPSPTTPPTPALSTSPKPATPQTTTPETQPSPPPEPGLPGTYTLADSTAAERINAAIEAAVKDTSWPFQGPARDKLRKKNLPPPPEIVIAYTPSDVSIKTFKGEIQTPANDKFVSRIVDGDKVDVSTKRVGKKLVRTYKTGEGQRVNTYSLTADGKILTMHVNATSSFTKPCVYELKYKRTN